MKSNHVYRDMEYNNPEDWATKAALTSKIYDIIETRGWTQKQAADVLRIDQPGVSDLKRGRLRRFSIARLISFLRALDQEVEIVIRPKSNTNAPSMVADAGEQTEYRIHT